MERKWKKEFHPFFYNDLLDCIKQVYPLFNGVILPVFEKIDN